MPEIVDYNTLEVTVVFTNEQFTCTLRGAPAQLMESLQAALFSGTVFIGTLKDGRNIFIDMRRVGILIF